jgi:hypothetical protein
MNRIALLALTLASATAFASDVPDRVYITADQPTSYGNLYADSTLYVGWTDGAGNACYVGPDHHGGSVLHYEGSWYAASEWNCIGEYDFLGTTGDAFTEGIPGLELVAPSVEVLAIEAGDFGEGRYVRSDVAGDSQGACYTRDDGAIGSLLVVDGTWYTFEAYDCDLTTMVQTLPFWGVGLVGVAHEPADLPNVDSSWVF